MFSRPRRSHTDRDTATECRPLNVLAHPEPPEGCAEKGMMCCGYCTPAVIAALSAALVLVSDAYDFVLIAGNPTSAWRIVVCLIVFVLTTLIGFVVLWSYYAIIFGAPGFVPRVPWMYPPQYAGPPLPPQRGSTRAAARSAAPQTFSPAAGLPSSPPPPAAALPQPLTGSPPRSLTRRSPNASAAPRGHTSDGSAAVPAAVTTSSTSTGTADCANPLHAPNGAPAGGDVIFAGCTDDSESAAAPMLQAPAAGGDGSTAVLVVSALEVEGAPAEARTPCARSSHSPFPPAPQTQGAALPPPSQASPNPYAVCTLDRTGAFRFCHTCQIFKPDNAHHCSVCRRCVFNFDHHCPFVNNCVGRNNYKLFILFLLYSGTGATLAGCLMLVTIFAVDSSDIMSKIGWIAVPGVDLVLGLALLLFYCQHRVLLCRGQSTLDNLMNGHNDTFQGWRRSFYQPKLTPEQKAEEERLRREKVERHNRTLLGAETPWWRRFVPVPVRTDDTADDAVPASV